MIDYWFPDRKVKVILMQYGITKERFNIIMNALKY